MLAAAGDGVEAIDVLTPFFDPKGEALIGIATRTSQPVRALLQKGRESLTQDAAGRLPDQVTLASFEPVTDGSRAPFVHAKAFALRKADRVTFVAGSANCSQAALLADQTWGNAELVAVSDVPMTEVDALFADFVILSQPPELPADAPSDSWASETVPLRLLAARRTEARLDVHFKASLPLTEMHLVSAEGEKFNATELVGDEHAVFSLTQPTAWVRLMAAVDGGSMITSDAIWVDDETALRASGPERQLREHLHDAAARDHLTSDEYLKILELFDQHVRQPVTRIVRRGDGKDRPPGVRLYRREDVFTADFGRAAPVNANSEYRDYRPQDTWALFLSFFQILQERDPAPSQRPTPSVNDDPGEGEGKKEAQKPHPSEARPRDLRPKVLRVVSRIEDAMSRAEFVDSRPPERLAADIGFAALLLTKAQHDGYLTADDFQGASGRLWKILFFGSDGRSGAIPERIARLSAEERLEFADAMRSPRLSAAMTVWCLGERRNGGQLSSWFRLSAALLAARLPWLTQGGEPEEIAKELDRVGQVLIPDSETELFAIWRSWLRCGIATAALEDALSSRSGLELMRLCSRAQIADGELLWQANAFHTAVGPCRRDASSKALVCPLGRPDAQMKFQGHFLVPVRDLVDADLGLAPEVCQELRDLIDDGRPARVAA